MAGSGKGWLEHPDSILARARYVEARNLGAREAIAQRTDEAIRVLIGAVKAQSGQVAEDLHVLLEAELVRRVREAA
jgi:hypothetical protein